MNTYRFRRVISRVIILLFLTLACLVWGSSNSRLYAQQNSGTQPVDMVLLLDVSASNRSVTLGEHSVRFIVDYMQLVVGEFLDIRIAVIPFAGNPLETIGMGDTVEEIGLESLTFVDLDLALDQIDLTPLEGGSDFEEALDKAAEIFRNESRRDNKRVAFLITDGEPDVRPDTSPGNIEQNLNYLNSNITEAVNRNTNNLDDVSNYELFVVGTGNSAPDYLPFWGNGRHHFTLLETAADFVGVYDALASAVELPTTNRRPMFNGFLRQPLTENDYFLFFPTALSQEEPNELMLVVNPENEPEEIVLSLDEKPYAIWPEVPPLPGGNWEIKYSGERGELIFGSRLLPTPIPLPSIAPTDTIAHTATSTTMATPSPTATPRSTVTHTQTPTSTSTAALAPPLVITPTATSSDDINSTILPTLGWWLIPALILGPSSMLFFYVQLSKSREQYNKEKETRQKERTRHQEQYQEIQKERGELVKEVGRLKNQLGVPEEVENLLEAIKRDVTNKKWEEAYYKVEQAKVRITNLSDSSVETSENLFEEVAFEWITVLKEAEDNLKTDTNARRDVQVQRNRFIKSWTKDRGEETNKEILVGLLRALGQVYWQAAPERALLHLYDTILAEDGSASLIDVIAEDRIQPLDQLCRCISIAIDNKTISALQDVAFTAQQLPENSGDGLAQVYFALAEMYGNPDLIRQQADRLSELITSLSTLENVPKSLFSMLESAKSAFQLPPRSKEPEQSLNEWLDKVINHLRVAENDRELNCLLPEAQLLLELIKRWRHSAEYMLAQGGRPAKAYLEIIPSLSTNFLEEEIKQGEEIRHVKLPIVIRNDGDLPAEKVQIQIPSKPEVGKITPPKLPSILKGNSVYHTDVEFDHQEAVLLDFTLKFVPYLSEKDESQQFLQKFALSALYMEKELGYVNPYTLRPLHTEDQWNMMQGGSKNNTELIIKRLTNSQNGDLFIVRGLQRTGKTSITQRVLNDERVIQRYLPIYIDLLLWKVVAEAEEEDFTVGKFWFELVLRVLWAVEEIQSNVMSALEDSPSKGDRVSTSIRENQEGIDEKLKGLKENTSILLSELDSWIKRQSVRVEEFSIRDVARLFRKIQESIGKKLLIVLDEADLLAQLSLRDSHFHLIKNVAVGMLHLVNKEELHFIIIHGWSDQHWYGEFYDIRFPGAMGKAVKTKLLTKAEVGTLARLGGLEFTRLAEAYLWRLTGGYPALVQLVCHQLYDNRLQAGENQIELERDSARVNGLISIQELKRITQKIMNSPEFDPFFAYLRHGFDPIEQGLLWLMAHKKLVDMNTGRIYNTKNDSKAELWFDGNQFKPLEPLLDLCQNQQEHEELSKVRSIYELSVGLYKLLEKEILVRDIPEGEDRVEAPVRLQVGMFALLIKPLWLKTD